MTSDALLTPKVLICAKQQNNGQYANVTTQDNEPHSQETGQWYDDDYDYDYGDGQFMVCDHCRGHGLPCNEAPVCEQCELSYTPCVHRWCPDNPHSSRDCPNPRCRYAHKDYLPVERDEGYIQDDYIILPGKLRGCRYDGKLSPQSAEGFNKRALEDQAIRHQKQGRRDFDRWVAEGAGTLDTLYCYCGKYCAKHNGIERSD